MPIHFADRVLETSTTTGTASFNLAGAVTGYRTFVAAIGHNKRVYYSAKLDSGNEWEVGIGTITDAATDTLSRDTVLSSSNSNNKVSFSAGTKNIACLVTADAIDDIQQNIDVIFNAGDKIDKYQYVFCNILDGLVYHAESAIPSENFEGVLVGFANESTTNENFRYGTQDQGYICGGITSGTTPVVGTDKLVFATKVTAAATTANLSQARHYAAGISNGTTKGYVIGGASTTTLYSTADLVTYATDTTAAATSANSTVVKNGACGLTEGRRYGYLSGGITVGTTRVATTDRLTFSNNTTAARTVANINQARDGLVPLSEGKTRGFFCGGQTANTAGAVSTIDQLSFASETNTSSTSFALIGGPRYQSGAVSEGTKGYVCGGGNTGDTPVALTDLFRYALASNSAATTANLTTNLFGCTGLSQGATAGYVTGGDSGAGTPVATTFEILFYADSEAAVTTANLSANKLRPTGLGCDAGRANPIEVRISGTLDGFTGLTAGQIQYIPEYQRHGTQTAGYFLGGDTSSGGAQVATTDKLTFSTNTTAAATAANLDQAKYSACGISEGRSFGYVTGGVSGASSYLATTSKVTYSNDTTAAQTTANLSQARGFLAGISEGSFKGYSVGGFSGVFLTTSDKIFFATDVSVSANISAGPRTATRSLVGYSEGQIKGYMTGGIISTVTVRQVTFVLRFALDDTPAALGTANISTTRHSLSAISDGKKCAYLSGGSTQGTTPFDGAVVTTDRMTFSSDLCSALTTANLSAARQQHVGISEGLTDGYYAGGSTAAAVTATAFRLSFSTETYSAQTSANLSQAREPAAGLGCDAGRFQPLTTSQVPNKNQIAIALSTTKIFINDQHFQFLSIARKGYMAGGNTWTADGEVLDFALEINYSKASVNLTGVRSVMGSLSDARSKGFFSGGETAAGTQVATCDKLFFPTDSTSSQTSTNLSQARWGMGSVSERNIKGYNGGGNSGAVLPASLQVTTDIVNYSTETCTASTVSNLTAARRYVCGITEGTSKGYMLGGYTQGGGTI